MGKHPTSVDGFEGTLRELAQRVCRMRYDHVAEFFEYCADELGTQAQNDYEKGRKQLSGKLDRVTMLITFGVAAHFHRIFKLCKSYMKEELASDNS